MSGHASALVGSTALVVVLVAALAFAVLKFMAAARAVKHQVRLGGSGDPALLSTALHDAVSSLKAREQAMSARAVASEELSAQVFDSLTAGLLVIDAEGRVRNVNPAARRLLSIATADGIDYRQLLAGAPALIEVIAEGLSAGGPVLRRSVHVRDGSRSSHFDVNVSPFGDPGSRHGAICLVSDLTTIVELEQQLQLKEALARLGELTAGIAHEFRNGLATIHGYSRLIDPDTLTPAYRTCIQGIRSETDALGRVVTNFLNFARPESIALVPVDLAAIVRGAADDLRPELPPATTLEVSGTFGVVPGDEVLLRQAVDNLIRNAAEACAVAGTSPSVTVAGELDAAKQLAVVSVEDNGPGIPEADRTRIFQPFFTTRSRGSGLGLSIVQKIVLLHNGKIVVGAAPGGGARLQLLLPLTQS